MILLKVKGTYSNGNTLIINTNEEEILTVIINPLDRNLLVLTQLEELDFDETDIFNSLFP